MPGLQDEEVIPLEVARAGGAEGFDHRGELVGRERILQLTPAPNIEFSLDALAVGILGGGEGALRRSQIAQHIVEEPPDLARVARLARHLECLEVCVRHRGLVAEHLLEVRGLPVVVGRGWNPPPR